MIDGVSEAERLYFVITEISDTEYHAFTMNYSDIDDNPVGTKIVAYLTVIKKDADDGEWKPAYSHRVLVKVNAPGVVSKAIDVTSWEMLNIFLEVLKSSIATSAPSWQFFILVLKSLVISPQGTLINDDVMDQIIARISFLKEDK